LSAPEIDPHLQRLRTKSSKKAEERASALIGIRRRGVPLAQRIALAMRGIDGVEVRWERWTSRCSRDDLSKVVAPVLQSSDIPFGVDNMDLVLVDDVLYTGGRFALR